MLAYLLPAILLSTLVAYFVGRARGRDFLAEDPGGTHSVPAYHGLYLASWVGAPALALVLIRAALGAIAPDPPTLPSSGDIVAARTESLANGAFLVLCLVMMGTAFLVGRAHLSPRFRARVAVERVLSAAMIACSVLALLTMAGIIFSLIYEAWAFFRLVPPRDFFLGLRWEPQIAIRADQIAGAGAFGAVPVFVGTALIALVAMAVALPIAILSAVYLLEYASPTTRSFAKPVLGVLVGVPTIVHGFVAMVTIAPAVRSAGAWIGLEPAVNSALAVGIATGIMIIPTICAHCDEALRAVPASLRDGSLALGASLAETLRHVILPAAAPGIIAGVLLALSRAVGETMIVLMAGGLIASLSLDPFGETTTMTVQIMTLLTGDTGFDTPKTLAAFALGLVLFTVTLGLNIVAFAVMHRYRARID